MRIFSTSNGAMTNLDTTAATPPLTSSTPHCTEGEGEDEGERGEGADAGAEEGEEGRVREGEGEEEEGEEDEEGEEEEEQGSECEEVIRWPHQRCRQRRQPHILLVIGPSPLARQSLLPGGGCGKGWVRGSGTAEVRGRERGQRGR